MFATAQRLLVEAANFENGNDFVFRRAGGVNAILGIAVYGSRFAISRCFVAGLGLGWCQCKRIHDLLDGVAPLWVPQRQFALKRGV